MIIADNPVIVAFEIRVRSDLHVVVSSYGISVAQVTANIPKITLLSPHCASAIPMEQMPKTLSISVIEQSYMFIILKNSIFKLSFHIDIWLNHSEKTIHCHCCYLSQLRRQDKMFHFVQKFAQLLVINSTYLNGYQQDAVYQQKQAMSATERKEYCQIIHSEILNSFARLTASMDELTNTSLLQHCRIWKLDKGAKNLIQLAIEGDKFLSKQSKSIRKTISTELKQQQVESNKSEKVYSKKRHRRSLFKDSNPCNQNKPTNKEDQDREAEESFDKIYEQSHNIKKENIQPNIDVKKEQYLSRLSQSEVVRQESDAKLFIDFESVVKKQIKLSKKKYMRGPYKNYSRELKQQMVQLYKSCKIPISKISLQFGVPIKNIKRWAQNGVERKQGAGRKRLDPNMEDELFASIKQKFPLGSQLLLDEVRILALNLSKYSDFKASKGWIINFIERYQLNKLYAIF